MVYAMSLYTETILGKHNPSMQRMIQWLAKCVVAMIATTLILTVVWEYTAADLYDCTDDGFPPGYLEPGDWVHSWDSHPVMTVPHIVHGRPMSEPDTIKNGWSPERLWHLWYSLFFTSLAVSIIVASLPWRFHRAKSSPAAI